MSADAHRPEARDGRCSPAARARVGRQFLRYPYTDEHGVVQGITTHSNYEVLRNLVRSRHSGLRVAPEWGGPTLFGDDDLRPIVLGVEQDVGLRPTPFHILVLWNDADGVYAPTQVRWVLSRSRQRRARAALGDSKVERWLSVERDSAAARFYPGGVIDDNPRECLCLHDCAVSRDCPEFDQMASDFEVAARAVAESRLTRMFQ